jgi:glycosyltransferase involved in cell wall biosynthesis
MPSQPLATHDIDGVHLRASNFVGGPERQILRYAGFEREGPLRVALATFVDRSEGEGQALLAAAEAQGIEAFGLAGGGVRDLAGVRQLIALLRQRRVRLVCAHAYRADLLGLWAARRAGVPIAWFLRGWTGEDRRVRAFEALDRRFLPHADRVVCLSENQRERVLALGIPAAKLRLVPNVVEAPQATRAEARAEMERRFRLRPQAVWVGAGGRLSPEKGAADLLAAASRLGRPEVEFIVFGDGPLRAELEQRARALGLAQLRFAGFVPDVKRLLPGLDVLVNPSRREEMPNIVLEAMAAGVAVVATAVGGVAEIAGDPATLQLVAPGQPEALAAAMEGLVADTARRAALAAAGRRRVASAYAPACQRASLRALYGEFLPNLDRG